MNPEPGEGRLVPEPDRAGRQEQLTLSLLKALDLLRDGIRPFVVAVLEEKEGPQWFSHPRVQRMVSAPPSLDGEAPYGAEGPTLDLALLLKLIGSDCYWYRTFSPRLSGISRWQIDSLRELRNRVAHNDGTDPLLTSAPLLLPYLATMEQLLRAVGSEHAVEIGKLRGALQRRRRQLVRDLALGRSRWSAPFWLATSAVLGAGVWIGDYLSSPKLERDTLVIGTPDRRVERYLALEQHLEAELRPNHILRALMGDKVNVRIEGARSYPEAVAHLRARRWDVLLGFSPVVSMEAIREGYRPIGQMFPTSPEYRAILFATKGSNLESLDDITAATRVALGDFFSATKYYVPMSLLRGRRARLTLDLSTAEIVEQVRSKRADVGAMAGNPQVFERINPGLKILASSDSLPQSIVALSPSLADQDRDRLRLALLSAPPSVRETNAANFGPGAVPDYRAFARQVSEGKAFSACINDRAPDLKLHCPSTDRIRSAEGWIEDVKPDGNQIRIRFSTADRQAFTLQISRELLEQSAVFRVLNELRGRSLKVIARERLWERAPLVIQTPHQLEIRS
jgi:ABC-type phosphate/phosphonate transport system substrate-binding protein